MRDARENLPAGIAVRFEFSEQDELASTKVTVVSADLGRLISDPNVTERLRVGLELMHLVHQVHGQNSNAIGLRARPSATAIDISFICRAFEPSWNPK